MSINNMLSVPYFDEMVRSRMEKILADLAAKYFVVFRRRVREKMLAHIDHERWKIGGNMRLSYDIDYEELIVRLLPKFHEEAYFIFSHEVTTKARLIGSPIVSLIPCGATRYDSHSGSSSKRVRLRHKPSAIRTSIPDWPTIVVESGFSESRLMQHGG